MAALISSLARSEDARSPGEEEVADSGEIDFNEHIRPIFTAHCTACHGGVKQAGDISFAYRDQVLPPDGWIVEPGDPEASSLIERVTSEDEDIRMPPPEHGPALSTLEIERLTQWIRQGAKWEQHWAYEQPQPQPIPTVSDADWPLRPMDNFVLKRLESEGIDPSPNATPERWLRRVTLDLTGLPPTLEDRNAFLNDVDVSGNAAYERVVDRLLGSDEYGERWASIWLDQVRYADSKGLGMDARRNIWKYRDWVIDAINRDLPYDQFTIKQIAGDLLPDPSVEDRIATAAHRLTQSNEEGGTDDEEFRVAAVLDRVNTTWQTWMGVTFGCVQCHSHPYDPFRHEEYYQFSAFFNNTADSDLDEDWPAIQAPIDPAEYPEAAELDHQIASLRDQIWQREYQLLDDDSLWQPLVDLQASSSNATQVEVERQGDHDEYHTVGTVSRNADFTLEAPLPDGVEQLTAIRFTAMPLDPASAVADSEWGFVLSHVEAELLVPGEDQPQPIELSHLAIDEPNPFYDPQLSLNEKSSNGFAAYTRIHYPRQAALIPQQPVAVPEGARLRVTLKHRRFILAAFALIAKRGHLAVSDDQRFTDLLSDEELSKQRNRLAALQQQRDKIPSTSVPVLRELPEHLSRPTHVFARGLFLTKEQSVTAATPKSLPPLDTESTPDRLAMARWIVSPENPLTARVAVNRFWARLFGVGLVATEEDFGSSGDPPSHPKLLDYLAVQFQNEYDWSVKNLLRDIVLSKTYRQSSKVRPELLESDPQNRLLARGPRQRLPAEIIRDQALALAGLLSDKRFGPPVHPPLPDGVWNPFQGGDRWTTPDDGDADRYRRSIYTYTKRSIPYPMFAAFDAPSREFCTPRRLRSNTPLQALMTLNDETFQECAAGLATRMKNASDQPREQIAFGFRLVTCREPDDAEIDELLALQKTVGGDDALHGLTSVAGVLLNLDEVLTK
ncbi:DUF1553 domain-containing protein [Roseiconus nitratireducens]|nr:PSD1 and planctomycete cytochrome C domain-containing protein [Roseiconus nitratireducens]